MALVSCATILCFLLLYSCLCPRRLLEVGKKTLHDWHELVSTVHVSFRLSARRQQNGHAYTPVNLILGAEPPSRDNVAPVDPVSAFFWGAFWVFGLGRERGTGHSLIHLPSTPLRLSSLHLFPPFSAFLIGTYPGGFFQVVVITHGGWCLYRSRLLLSIAGSFHCSPLFASIPSTVLCIRVRTVTGTIVMSHPISLTPVQPSPTQSSTVLYCIVCATFVVLKATLNAAKD